jgi:hypothetical protein
MIGRPGLVKKFELGVIACNGEAAKADLSVAPAIPRDRAAEAIMEGCIAQRGYVLREPQGAPTGVPSLILRCIFAPSRKPRPHRTRGHERSAGALSPHRRWGYSNKIAERVARSYWRKVYARN